MVGNLIGYGREFDWLRLYFLTTILLCVIKV